MKIIDGVHLIGSGKAGFMMTHPSDCHVWCIDTGDGCIMIDAGVGIDCGLIIAAMRADGIDPGAVRHVMLTHSHADHAGGAAYFRRELGAAVHISSVEAPLLSSSDLMDQGLAEAIRDGVYPDGYRFPNCLVDRELDDGDRLTLGAVEMRAIHTPGHSTGSIAYLADIGGRRCLFSGDVVLAGGKVLFLNCAGSVMADMRTSMPRLADLGVDCLFPGHGCFVLNDAQSHIDMAIEALTHLAPPPNGV